MKELLTKECFRQRTKINGDALFDTSYEEIEKYSLDFARQVVLYSDIPVRITDAVVYGSRSRGNGRTDSDIDVAIEYINIDAERVKEYVMFNLLHENEFYIANYKIDLNPITSDESGTLSQFLSLAEEYQKNKYF